MVPSSPPSDRLVGRVIGRYRLVQHLGSGGMADVYLAERTGAGEGGRVALKVLRKEHQASRALVARFEREASAAARVHHPNVLRVSDLELVEDEGPTNGRSFQPTSKATRLFAMELLVGLDLADTLSYSDALVPERAARIAVALADGLAAVHALGVVHRDVKPENIFLVHAADGREIVKLLDFGFAHVMGDPLARAPSARITERHTVVGTPEYMAPEQAQGAAATPAADVYSFGVVLFEMLTGRVPFTGRSFPEIAHQHAESAVPVLRQFRRDLVISPDLDALIVRCLAKKPSQRFSSATDLAVALRHTPEASR